jgi:hypothetical protein
MDRRKNQIKKPASPSQAELDGYLQKCLEHGSSSWLIFPVTLKSRAEQACAPVVRECGYSASPFASLANVENSLYLTGVGRLNEDSCEGIIVIP